MIHMEHLSCWECGGSQFKVTHKNVNDPHRRTIKCKLCDTKYSTFTPDFGVMEIEGYAKIVPTRRRKNIPKDEPKGLKSFCEDLKKQDDAQIIHLDPEYKGDLAAVEAFFKKLIEEV